MQLPVDYTKLTWKERREVRNEYVARQNNLCDCCSKPLNGPPSDLMQAKDIKESLFPPNFFKYPVHLHHDHRTGMTIGAVHSKCNAVLWQYYGE